MVADTLSEMEDKEDTDLFERFIYSPFGILAVLAVSAFAAVTINRLLGY